MRAGPVVHPPNSLAMNNGNLAAFVEKEFDALVAQKIKQYGGDALDAMRSLAMMRQTDNSYMMAVKLQACERLIKLMKPEDREPPKAEGNSLLEELNREYHRAAPRIREIRERTVVFDQGETVVGEAITASDAGQP